MVVESALTIAGLILLTFSADHLILGSSRIAARARVSPTVVGVVVIGLGTSAPELLVSGVAARRGDSGIAIGNIVGSNLLNLSLILGVAALVRTVQVSSSVIRREVRLTVIAGAVFVGAALIGLNRCTGVVLLLSTAVALALLLRWARAGRSTTVAADAANIMAGPAIVDLPMVASRWSPWGEPVRALLGLAGVLAGAELLVTNASRIATSLGVPQTVIGLTIVAAGTSLPELVTTVAAQRRGESQLVIGNLFGSNLFNSLAGGAVIGLAQGHPTSRPDLAPLTAMVLASLLAAVLLRRGLRLSRVEGGLLIAAYLLCLPVILTAG